MKPARAILIPILLLFLIGPATIKAVENNKNVERLKILGQACLKYMQNHDGQIPPTLSALYNETYIKDLSLFTSPSGSIRTLRPSNIDEMSDYVLCPEKDPIIPEKPYLIVMKIPYDKFRPIIRDRSEDNNPKTKHIYVFFEDNTVYPLRPVEPPWGELEDDRKTEQLAEKTNKTDVEVVRDFFPGHPFFIDMDGNSGDKGILTSKKAFELRPGKYRIRFNLVGDPIGTPRRVHFRVGNVFEDEVTMGNDEMVCAYKQDIVVKNLSVVRLVFQHQGGDFQNLMLDNVRLTKLTGQSR